MGSEFIARLPCEADGDFGRARADGDARASPRRRVLVVDDDRDAADSLGMLLDVGGHEVRVAHDGVEGVELAAAFRPEVVLLDLGLPKLSGYEVARRIRSLEEGSQVLLVALTGWGQDEDRLR